MIVDHPKIAYQGIVVDTAPFQCTVIFTYEIPRFGHVAIIVAEICRSLKCNSILYKLNLTTVELILLLIKARLFDTLH